MARKVLICGGIVIATVIVILLMTLVMPLIQANVDVAASDPLANNFTGYKPAVQAAPLWIYGIPVVIAGVAIFVTLRMPEKNS